MNHLMLIWPAVVGVEMGSLAFIAHDFKQRQAELERDRERANEFLSSRGMNAEAVQERIDKLERKKEDLKDKSRELAAEKRRAEGVAGYDATDGLFDGMIASVMEERRISWLEEEKLREETERIKAETAAFQKQAEAEEKRGNAIMEESAAKVAEAERESRRKPLEDALAMVARRRETMGDKATELAEAMERKAAEPDPVKRAAGLAPLIPLLEMFQKEFAREIERESEIEGDLIELSKIKP